MTRPLRILLVDDEDIVHQTLGDYLRHAGHHVEPAHDATGALREVAAREYDLALLDIRLAEDSGLDLLHQLQSVRPDIAVVMISGHGTMETVIEALRAGAVDYLKKPIRLEELDAVVEKAARVNLLQRRNRYLAETIADLQTADPLPHLVGQSEHTAEVRRQIQQAVEAACPTVLITGETGTGKEVVARAFHQLAHPKAPFVPVCCPALPETLAESELFGHVRGAFTGAAGPRPGHFELADGGTLFLDEIADLTPPVQAKLLRVLETRAVRRIGAPQELTVNVKVLAATNVDLELLVEQGRFRPDLFYRLNVFQIHLQPLRGRPDDILPLAHHFLALALARRPMPVAGFSPEAERRLLAHPYPGNARELRNLIERAVILCRHGHILPEHLALSKRPEAPPPPVPAGAPAEAASDEAAVIRAALEGARWNRRQAAIDLGMPYSTLRYKIMRYGIE
ncbi:MAG: sigma-54-dependent Fis family transcriptional regulator [Candidatus Sumerlaeia bacterium]|nr:sigma-54-dependent Fis family transcriptional regulator [Candidatus Sumerlaeia bacterium]